MYIFTIIIPVYQELNIFRLFYNSLCTSIKYKTQIIFVNDNSGEAVGCFLNEVSKNSPSESIVEVINNKNNQGCAKCINEALPLIKGIYTVLMDSDIILPTEWQNEIIKTFKDKTDICVGGVLIYPQTGGIQNCGIAYTHALGRHLFLNSKVNRLEKYGIYEVQSSVFAFFVIPTITINKVGKINEAFFNGYEDLDYQMRIRKQGSRILINPDIKIYHWEQSNGIHRSQNRKSNLGLFWKKHGDFIVNDLWDFLFFELENCNGLQSKYIGIDLSGNKLDAKCFWDKLNNKYPNLISMYFDYSHWVRDLEPILIPKVCSIDLFRERQPILFLCDNFVQLLGNYYWCSFRSNFCKSDVIIDLYGNVVNFETIISQFWPGQKIR